VTSGKAAKRARKAQAQTPQHPKKRVDTRQGDRRQLYIIGGAAVAVVAAVVVVLVLVLSGSSAKHYAQGAALPEASLVNSLLQGIPQNGLTLGDPKAPVTMVEYIDLQCPYCKAFETQTFPTLVKKYVRTGKLKVETRLLSFIGPDSTKAGKAALAAGAQNDFFNFSELLYFNQGVENSGWVTDDMLAAAASSTPSVNVDTLMNGRGGGQKQLDTFASQATKDKVSSTPTLLVGKSGQKLQVVAITSPTDLATVETAIAAALAK
jgi:protein-disulfide isomerase